jgi:hypothetical protein
MQHQMLCLSNFGIIDFPPYFSEYFAGLSDFNCNIISHKFTLMLDGALFLI